MKIKNFKINSEDQVILKITGEVLRAFHIELAKDFEPVDFKKFEITNELKDNIVKTKLVISNKNGEKAFLAADSINLEEKRSAEIHRLVKKNLYEILTEKLKLPGVPYGIMHGVRPTKIIHRWLRDGFGITKHGVLDRDRLARRLRTDYLTSYDKSHLLTEVSIRQIPILNSGDERTVAIYIGIPFCVTRCLYCSFPAHTLPNEKKIAEFMEVLNKDIDAAAEEIKNYGFNVQSIYIGGGTPSALPENFFADMMHKVTETFYTPDVEEFTVECGRPDTISYRKITVMKECHVTRISVNPQSMKQETLDKIGRKHTVEQIYTAFKKVRSTSNFKINMDLILGLPGENLNDVKDTLEKVLSLNPDDITLHALAIKRGSRLQTQLADEVKTLEDYELPTDEEVRKMAEVAERMLRDKKYLPYYLYRQGYISGQIENIGYCQPGAECIYNIQSMDERQTIIGIGAAATTKVPDNENLNLETSFNAKDLKTYMQDIDKYIANRSKALADVYRSSNTDDLTKEEIFEGFLDDIVKTQDERIAAGELIKADEENFDNLLDEIGGNTGEEPESFEDDEEFEPAEEPETFDEIDEEDFEPEETKTVEDVEEEEIEPAKEIQNAEDFEPEEETETVEDVEEEEIEPAEEIQNVEDFEPEEEPETVEDTEEEENETAEEIQNVENFEPEEESSKFEDIEEEIETDEEIQTVEDLKPEEEPEPVEEEDEEEIEPAEEIQSIDDFDAEEEPETVEDTDEENFENDDEIHVVENFEEEETETVEDVEEDDGEEVEEKKPRFSQRFRPSRNRRPFRKPEPVEEDEEEEEIEQAEEIQSVDDFEDEEEVEEKPSPSNRFRPSRNRRPFRKPEPVEEDEEEEEIEPAEEIQTIDDFEDEEEVEEKPSPSNRFRPSRNRRPFRKPEPVEEDEEEEEIEPAEEIQTIDDFEDEEEVEEKPSPSNRFRPSRNRRPFRKPEPVEEDEEEEEIEPAEEIQSIDDFEDEEEVEETPSPSNRFRPSRNRRPFRKPEPVEEDEEEEIEPAEEIQSIDDFEDEEEVEETPRPSNRFRPSRNRKPFRKPEPVEEEDEEEEIEPEEDKPINPYNPIPKYNPAKKPESNNPYNPIPKFNPASKKTEPVNPYNPIPKYNPFKKYDPADIVRPLGKSKVLEEVEEDSFDEIQSLEDLKTAAGIKPEEKIAPVKEVPPVEDVDTFEDEPEEDDDKPKRFRPKRRRSWRH